MSISCKDFMVNLSLPEGWYWDKIEQKDGVISGIARRVIRHKLDRKSNEIVDDLTQGDAKIINTIEESANTDIELASKVRNRIANSDYKSTYVEDAFVHPIPIDPIEGDIYH